MLIFQRKVFIFLLAGLQWTKCTGFTNESSMTIDTSIMSAFTSSTVTQQDENSTVTEYYNQSSTTTLFNTGTNQTTQELGYSTEDTTPSFTSETRMSYPSEIHTTTSNPLASSESYANTTNIKLSEAASNSFTTTNYDVSFTTMVSNNDTQTTSVTAPPDDTASDMPLSTSNNSKTVSTTIQVTKLHPDSAETQEPRKDNHSDAGVIIGAIIGAVLGSALIGLVCYFLCKKRKSEGFVHQRLYDDTGNDPANEDSFKEGEDECLNGAHIVYHALFEKQAVLRLDNAPELYDKSFADLSYHNPTLANETTAQSNTPPYDAIPMDDMSLSPHLP